MAKDETKKSSDGGDFSYKLQVPKFSECVTYDLWRNEIVAWGEFSGVDIQKKAGIVAFSLPHNHSSKIREKVFQNISVTDLKASDGFKKLLDFMDSIFKKDNIVDAWQKFELFESMIRKPGQEMTAFINDFDLAYNQLEKLNMSIPKSILSFKLLKNARISEQNKLLVLTGMDFKDKDLLYDTAKAGLKKFHDSLIQDVKQEHKQGEQAMKLEPDPVLAGFSNGRQNNGYTPFKRRPGPGRGHHGGYHGRGKPWSGRKNPIGSNGRMLTCHICKSTEHLRTDCPHQYPVKLVETSSDSEGEIDTLMSSVIVLADSLGKISDQKNTCAILDTACSSTVCGKSWLKNYIGSLSEKAKTKVVRDKGYRRFRFGGGEVLYSEGLYTIPAILAGKSVKIKVDVVESEIPLLLSKDSMKVAQIKLNLPEDTAEIYGVTTKLQVTPSGHYYVEIGENCWPGEIIPIENVCAVSLTKLSPKKLRSSILKLHRQFAHPPAERLKLLLKDCGSWKEEMNVIIEEIVQECDVCKIHAKTPPRPSVSMAIAHDFNDKVALDLKKWRSKWILHMVDMWSRLTVSVFIDRKKPSAVIDNVMKHWVGAGFGIMGTVFHDNGGEFSSDEMREVCSILNVEVMTTAAESPFQNGICERNHSVVDAMLAKLVDQCPNTPMDVLLAWACNAKNSLQMQNGFSSYQIVFGRNPRLPNVMEEQMPALDGKTTSETLATHLNSLHAARRAFVEAETSERVRRALRTQVRTSEMTFDHGDRVFYKREQSERWLGPARVVFQDGKVIFVRHGGVFVRVSPSRLKKANSTGVVANPPDENERIVGQPSRGSEFEKSIQLDEDDVVENNGVDFQIRNSRLRTEPRNAQPAPSVPVPSAPGPEPTVTATPVDQEIPPVPVDPVIPVPAVRNSSRNLVRPDYAKLHREGTTYDNQNTDVLVNFRANGDDEKKAVELAKQSEMENWRKYSVYDEVEDEGQSTISTRWVLSKKKADDGSTRIKARLVARGYEEEVKSQSDSPTANKETLRTFLALSANMKWQCKSIDIRAAFLQGKLIDRELYLKPPRDLRLDGILWKLKRTVYGLTDASRSWYFSVRDALLHLGCQQSKLDLSMFTWYGHGQLAGMLVLHVDDFLWSGSEEFKDLVIASLSRKFEIGKEAEGSFRYIGLDVSHENGDIVISQSEYVDSIDPIPVSKTRSFHKHLSVSEEERTALRQVVGKLNWITTQTRPEMSFETLDLSTSVPEATVSDLIRANKAVKQLKFEHGVIRFPFLGDFKNAKIIVHSDASLANLRDGASSAQGYVVFLLGENGRSCPLIWKSTKIKRVVKSTLCAEAMALVDAIDEALYIRHLLCETLGSEFGDVKSSFPIHAFVDNRSLFENLNSTKSAHEKVLRIDLAIVKEHLSKGEITSVKWLDSKSQLADVLTKRGPSPAHLKMAVNQGLQSLPEVCFIF